MSSFLKIATASAFTALFVTGCATTNEQGQIVPSAQKTVEVNAVSAEGVGQNLGTITFQDSIAGLVISTNLTGLPAGERGFHIHENPSCAPAEKDGKMGAALAAGSHLNTNGASNHGTPLTGHLGDLPALKVAADGTANVRLIAPRLKVADITNRSVMVHAGGDNYSDLPKALGGGGERIACGVIR